MDSQSFQYRYPVHRTGCIAARTLGCVTAGRVVALFDSSFYIETEAGLLCIGHADLEDGPLNLITGAPASTKWSANGPQIHARACISRQAIGIGDRFCCSLTGATEWSPDRIPGALDVDKLALAIRTFRDIAADLIPTDGLGQFLISGFCPHRDHAVCRAASRSLPGLRRWMVSAFRESDRTNSKGMKHARPLIGLGPGLTPSGDDLIGGIMIALHGLGEPEICRRFWLSNRHHAKEASNAISYAHLAAAAEGKGNAAIHRVFAAVADGDRDTIRDGILGIDRVGHTSGWDAAAGAIIALECWIEARRRQMCS